MLDKILKFIFPKRCVICDTVLAFGDKLENESLCHQCRNKIEFIKEPTCKKCGAMIYGDDEAYCVRCQGKLYDSFEYGFGLCRYNDAIKESLHRIKYKGRKEYIAFYGKCIAKLYHKKIREIKPEYLVPVPIHKERLRERNYNQSSVLAYAISDALIKYGINVPVNENIIFRSKSTKVLNKLDNLERAKELDNAFTINNTEGIDSVLLIDDIYTTGSTIDHVSKMLKKANISSVYFAVIAIVDNL